MNTAQLEETTRLLINLSIMYGPKILVALGFLVLGAIVAKGAGRALGKWFDKRDVEPPVRSLLQRVTHLVVMLLFLLMALQNLGVELLPLIAGIGVAGVGISLALQGVLQNLAAGLSIIFTKPYRVGEYIELLGVQGQVLTVDLFTTTLQHADKSKVVIPNRKIVGEILHNYGRMRQLDLSVGVAYSTDLPAALAVVQRVLSGCTRVLPEHPSAPGVCSLGDSAIVLAIKPWVKVEDVATASAEIYAAVVEQFRAARIDMPFPQREIRMLAAG